MGITISYEDFRLLNLRRRSVRSFKNEIVERERKLSRRSKLRFRLPAHVIDSLLGFRVVDDKEKILEVGELPLGGYNLSMKMFQ